MTTPRQINFKRNILVDVSRGRVGRNARCARNIGRELYATACSFVWGLGTHAMFGDPCGYIFYRQHF